MESFLAAQAGRGRKQRWSRRPKVERILAGGLGGWRAEDLLFHEAFRFRSSVRAEAIGQLREGYNFRAARRRMTPIPFFISYSRNDSLWMERVKTHLAPLENENLIDVWVDVDDLRAADSEEWDPVVLAALERARIVVVLLSPQFAASRYCHTKELPMILEKKARGDCKVYFLNVIPHVIDSRISKYIVRPSDKLELSEAKSPDAELKKIAAEIKSDIDTLHLPMEKRRALGILEDEARRVAHDIGLEPREWMREARLLDSFPEEQYDTFSGLTRRLAGMPADRGPRLIAALLMLGANKLEAKAREAAYDSIRDSAQLGPVYSEALALADEVKRGRVEYYLVRTDAQGERALEVTRFFQSGRSLRLDEWNESRPLVEAGDLVADDVWDKGESSAVIRVMTGPDRMVSPAADVLKLDQDKYFQVLFLSTAHVERRRRGRARLDYQTRLNAISEKVARGPWAARWCSAESDHLAVEFPALAPGSADELDRMLDDHIPYAAVARTTAEKFDRGGVTEVLRGKTFAAIPKILKEGRAPNMGCILSYLSIIWDDRFSYDQESKAGYQ